MSTHELMAELVQLGVKLELRGDGQLGVNAPKGRLSSEMIDRIRAYKSELIDLLSNKQHAQAEQPLPTIVPDPNSLYEPFAAGDLQTAFLMGDAADMEFHVRPHYYLEEDFESLDPARFEQALNAALHRQRANLVVVTQDMRLQTLRTFTPIQVSVYDLRSLPMAQANAALLQTRAGMSRHTLPVDRWPWFECAISLYGNGQARLHWNNNNVFSDGYGSQQLLADTLHYYHTPSQPLPELSLSFRDCMLALAQLEESPLGQASQRYWLDRLPHLPAAPALPMKPGVDTRSRSLLQRREYTLPAPLWSRFKQAARAHGLTPSNALFAVHAEVMACWSGSRHFLLNNMVTHRFPMHAQVTDIVGNFASLYPLEVDWRNSKNFAQRACDLQERIMTDLQHVYWSGVKVLQALNQLRKTPGKAPAPYVVGSGLFMPPRERPTIGCLETPQVLFDHQFWELSDGSLWFVWDVIERFFPAGMLDDMWDAYRTLLERFANDATAWSQTRLDLLAPAQRQQRQQINGIAGPVPQLPLHAPLAEQAALQPDRMALQTRGVKLSYAQLQACAQGLAHRMQETGAGRHDVVAIILDKGCEQLVAACGVLSIGAAYVPIDPQWPAQRRDYLLAHTKAKLVLTRRTLCDTLEVPSRFPLICVDDCMAQALQAPGQAPTLPAVLPQDLAYIIFTSGSTGMPKGVMVEHGAAHNTIADINQRFGVSASDVMYGISSLSFDLSVYDLFGSVAAGATLVLPHADSLLSPQAWLKDMLSCGVTVWNSVPALMQLLVDAALAAGATLPTLRLVMLSGDWIPVHLPQQIQSIAPQARVISLGGATEASIWSIYFPVDHCDSNWVSIPYGKPLTNQSWHVLDDSGHDAPTWTPGHLHIGGVGLARGYWQDGDKTDTAFVRHAKTGERLYRTGDMGRYLPDGNIEFLGRSDFQVKIQGFRVELGEIEQALAEHPQVRTATVVATNVAAGKQLLAFVVPTPDAQPLGGEALLPFLQGRLPRYMVPSQVVEVDRLPLTANGKVDRQALLALGADAPQKARKYAAPRSDLERELVAIWEDVLAHRPIGVHDDFFELGGQSFAAVRMMTRIGTQRGQRLPLSLLLEGPTIAQLAQRLGHHGAWSPLVPIHLAERTDVRACFFVHPAGGNVLCYRGLAQALGLRFYGLQAAGLSGEQPPLAKVEHMAALYLRAIREVQPQGPYLLGGWSSGGTIAFAIAQQLESEGEQVQRIWMLDTPAPLPQKEVSSESLAKWFLEDLDLGIDTSRIVFGQSAHGGAHQTLTALLAQLPGHQRTQTQLNPQQMELVYQVFCGIVRACRNYHPAAVSAPISVLRAKEGVVSEFKGHPASQEPDWGWSAFTRAGTTAATVDASHYTMLAPHHLATLTAAIMQHINGPSTVAEHWKKQEWKNYWPN